MKQNGFGRRPAEPWSGAHQKQSVELSSLPWGATGRQLGVTDLPQEDALLLGGQRQEEAERILRCAGIAAAILEPLITLLVISLGGLAGLIGKRTSRGTRDLTERCPIITPLNW
jgi:hypothetical protein